MAAGSCARQLGLSSRRPPPPPRPHRLSSQHCGNPLKARQWLAGHLAASPAGLATWLPRLPARKPASQSASWQVVPARFLGC